MKFNATTSDACGIASSSGAPELHRRTGSVAGDPAEKHHYPLEAADDPNGRLPLKIVIPMWIALSVLAWGVFVLIAMAI